MVKKREVHKNIVLLILAAAQFMVVLDVSIVNVALPSIYRGLHFTSASSLQWVVTAYTLAFGGFLLLGGRAADLFGRKRIFLGGVTLFALSSLACALSKNPTMIEVTRAIEGLAGAFMSPSALSIVLTTFKEGHERNKALSVWGAVAAGGAAAGVLVGGFLTQYLSWRWNFFVNVPVGILVIIATILYVPESKADLDHRQLDIPGAALITGGLMLLVYGLTKAPSWGWTSANSLEFIGASIGLIFLFIFNELRVKHPLMPLSIFKIRNLAGANLTQLPVTASLFSMFFFITFYIQTILGYSQVRSGLGFLPITIVVGIVASSMSKVVRKVGYKVPLVLGPLFLGSALFYLTHIQVGGSYFKNVFPGLLIMALGLGMVFVSITIAATNGVPKHESGLASGLLNTSQQVGGSLGLAILTGVSTSATTKYLHEHFNQPGALQYALVNGYQHAFEVGVGFAIVAFLFALFIIRENRDKQAEVDLASVVGA